MYSLVLHRNRHLHKFTTLLIHALAHSVPLGPSLVKSIAPKSVEFHVYDEDFMNTGLLPAQSGSMCVFTCMMKTL